MKIAIIVHGRFHAFDLTRGLTKLGHDVTVLTNYPKWAAAKFGLTKERVRSFWMHGILARSWEKVRPFAPFVDLEPYLHQMFGAWAARQVGGEPFDVVHGFSGVVEESLHRVYGSREAHFMVRGSAHIRTQDRLLAEEAARAGFRLPRPSAWMIAREEREYALADRIVVLSTFAHRSFIENGVPPEKLVLIPLGVEAPRFRPGEEVILERCRRIREGEPLRILCVGTLSFRKGLLDFQRIAASLPEPNFSFRFVGDTPREGKQILKALRKRVELVRRQKQTSLPKWYAQGDVFMFPTIEDGFAAVLAQAQANGLPILTTTNCSGPDIVREGENGWILPIRRPEGFIERLQWCERNRDELADLILREYRNFTPPAWDARAQTTADAFESAVLEKACS